MTVLDLEIEESAVPSLTDNIKRFRKEKGWSQAELAERIGTTLSHVNRIETGKYKPSLDVLIKLSDALEASLDELVRENHASLEVRIENRSFAEKIRLLESLDEEERQAVSFLIDAVLTKKKLLSMMKEIAAT